MRKRKFVFVLLLSAAIFGITACDLIGERGSGDLVTETREVSNYDSIALEGSGDVIVTQGGGESLIVETDDNLMEQVETEVRNGTLYLGFETDIDDRGFSPTRLIFTVGVDDLKGLSVSGSGNIESDMIETDSLEATISGSGEILIGEVAADDVTGKISGSGKIDLAGVTATQDVTVGGSGNYRAGDLQSESAEVSVSGSGNATVWATETLDASISGSGSIDYYGNPSVNQSTSGSGDVNNRGDK